MDSFDLDGAMAILKRTPSVLRASLAGLGDEWVFGSRGEGTFSPFDVVGHLIHGEKSDWMTRARTILDHGENRAFEPFDRFAMHEESRGKTLAVLLDTFETLRTENLIRLAEMRLTEDHLDKRGRHPALGVVTLRQLIATWAAHDLNHIMQIARTMAWRYRDQVGPWREYLGVLREAV
jgi:hypothetical protein